MSDKRRLIEQSTWIDDDFLHLGGNEPNEGEPESWWLSRRLARQGIWLGMIGVVANDWGRFRATPKRVAALLMPNVQSDWYEAEVKRAMDEFEALHWMSRWTYTQSGREIEYGVLWAWFKIHFHRWSKGSRIPAPPQELIQAEAERRGLLPHSDALKRGEMSRELFETYNCWMGTRQALSETYPDLVFKQPRAMKRSNR